MLEKLPGVASADADKTTSSATIIYDKSVFDVNSIGDEGRYSFELREDSAANGEASEVVDPVAADDGDADEGGEEENPSMIKIEDAPAEGSSSKSESNIIPSLDGPSS